MKCSNESCSATAYCRSMCKSCYHKAYRRGELLDAPYAAKTKKWTAESLLKECENNGSCMNWTGCPASSYPETRHGGSVYKVHRLMYELHTGDPVGGRQIHHTCANSRCINPHHLEAASQADNVLEMLARRDYEARITALEAKVKQLEAQLDTHRVAVR